MSDEGGGLDAPDTDLEAIEEHIGRLPDSDLKQVVVAAQQLIDRTHAEMAFLVRELDRRHLPELDEGLSTVGWRKRHTPMTASQASGTVKTARVLGHMPSVMEAALEGAVPHRSLQLLAQARNRHKIEFVDHESVFGDIATYLSVADLRRGIERWEQQINFDQALKDASKLETLRGFHHSQTYDGIWVTKGTFTPEGGHIMSQAIIALVGPTNLDPTELPTPAQRRADAMVDICSFFLTHNTNIATSGGEKPHVTIILDYETLKGQVERLPEIHRTPVTPNTIRRITCDAGIIPMVLGSDSEPLDVGRKTRTIPTALRRALEQRDKGCTWEGCGAPVPWCDAHHIIHWADGGETNLTNTQLLCRTHHTSTHQDERSPPDP
jgi:hypothetical protein